MAKRRKTVKRPAELAFDYIKANQFRVIAMDGAFGGLSPNGKEIHMAIFNERRPIPTKSVHAISADGLLGKEISERRESRSSFIRQVEVDIVFDLETAQTLQIWLTEKIEQMSKIQVERLATLQELQIRKKANGSKARK